MSILLTGGIGYIGSHTAVNLLENGFKVIVIDNLSNCSIDVFENIKTITKKEFAFINVDVVDKKKLAKVFEEHEIDSVIHFAGLKSVNESIKYPLEYYVNNVVGTINLIECMKMRNVNKLIFSSSATVYDANKNISPMDEKSSLSPINPYGRTKLMIENILKDYSKSNKEFKTIILRYFNPVGAHESSLIGESPVGVPNNLMPYITQVASGKRDKLKIFGNDYNTHDGTGVRDFIHVVDLAEAHEKALEKIDEIDDYEIYNIGTGTGFSVLDLVCAFEKTNKIKIPYEIVGRRAGDVAVCYANCEKANKELNWKAKKNIDEMCRDSWNWEVNMNM